MPDGAPLVEPDAVAGRIATLLQEKRPGAVKPLLAALEKLAPEHAELPLLRSAYCSQIGDVATAQEVVESALAAQPENAELLLRHAEIRYGQADFVGAAQDAAAALLAAPRLNRAKSVLGLALMQLRQVDAARACLEESFAADPAAADVALGLAALAPERAIAVLLGAVAANPGLGVLRNALTRRYLGAGSMAKAMQNAVRSRADGLADAETYCLLGFAQMQEGQWEEAAVSVAQAQYLAPGLAWPARLAVALGAREAGQIRPPRQLDALQAERALIAGGTILPGAFSAALEEHGGAGRVLDLFCGTGLNVIAAREICAGPWAGVEPDPELLRLCAERGLYKQTRDAEPLAVLAEGAAFEIVLLNEAFGFHASPTPWFDALRHGLAPGGIALAAIPTGNGLTGHGLFGHGLEEIAQGARQAGLVLSLPRFGVLRHIEGIPLQGVIASFRKL